MGYVSQANENDILSSEIIKDKFVQGLKVGKTGLEKSLENDLIGTNSIERYEVNAYGRRISQLAYQPGNKGKTIKLSIDTEVQKLANQLLKDQAGSICVMDIFTVDRLNITAEKFGLGKKVLGDYFDNEKKGLFPNTKWKKNNLGKGWVLGETLITGIGQGYTQTTPLQLCMMTAQIANGGFAVKPKIIVDSNPISYEDAKQSMESGLLFDTDSEELLDKKLFKNQRNIKIVQEAMFA